jgi:hypothetical protein
MKVEGGQPFRNYWAGETKEYEQALEAVDVRRRNEVVRTGAGDCDVLRQNRATNAPNGE